MNENEDMIKNAKKTIKIWLVTRKQLFNLRRKNKTSQAENRVLKKEIKRVKSKVSKTNLNILDEAVASRTSI